MFSSFLTKETVFPKKDLSRNCKTDMDYAEAIEDWLFYKICSRFIAQDALNFIFLIERLKFVQFVLFET